MPQISLSLDSLPLLKEKARELEYYKSLLENNIISESEFKKNLNLLSEVYPIELLEKIEWWKKNVSLAKKKISVPKEYNLRK